MPRVRVALCQINTVVGDLDGNVERVLAAYDQAEADGCDLAVFPELAVTGYPPEDLLLKPGFVAASRERIEKVAARTGRCVAFVGFVDADRDLRNAAAVVANGAVHGTYHKRLLPNYAVFDEKRYFAAGVAPMQLFEVAGVRVGVSICEDAWSPDGPIAEQAAGGAELIVNLNASPYYAGRVAEPRAHARHPRRGRIVRARLRQPGGRPGRAGLRRRVARVRRRRRAGGASPADGRVGARRRPRRATRVPQAAPRSPRTRQHAAALPVVAVTPEPVGHDGHRHPVPTPALAPAREVYEALVLGTRDYIEKNGFTDVVLGLSGGIDSSLVTTIAVDAIGPERVHPIALPSRFSTEHSISDSEQLCTNLGLELRTIAIEPAHEAMLEMLAPWFEGLSPDVTEENLQGRIRAALLMALANKFRGWLVLICGNKSELAVGYTTIYGVDMAGGFAVIKDVFKTHVYELARERNERAGFDLIPANVLTKPPSAELAPGQRDDQNLPPYDVLDPILRAYVEGDGTRAELIAGGFDAATVERVTRLVDVAEWKRRQAPIGVRVTPKAFGKDRRLPITNKYAG